MTTEAKTQATSKGTLEGKCIDEFNVLELKGSGGFSDVYKVKDNLGQIFAMKLVRDKKHAQLLAEEAKILSSMNHPQIPNVIRFGTHENKPFFVMDYVEQTLQDVVNDLDRSTLKKPKGLNLVLDLIQQTLNVLEYTHAQGIIHKDLKPKNIGYDEETRAITIYDFNIAKNLISTAKETPDVCSVIESDVVNVGGIQKSVLGGTEGYSSPEQKKMKVDGKVHDVDERSDLYTVGAILYELLIGNLPQGSYEKPSDKIGTPKWIDAVIDKALAQNPTKRYKTARDMRDDIKNGLEGKLDAQDPVVKYVKETLLPAATSGINAVGKGLWKTIKFPFWVYGFGIPAAIDRNHMTHHHSDDQDPCMFSCALTALGTLALWAFSIYSGLNSYSSFRDSQFVEDFKKNPQGTIVCERDGRIRYFRAKDALQHDIKYNETAMQKCGIENLTLNDGTIYFTASETGYGHALYSLNLTDGKEKKVFDLDKTLDTIIANTNPSNLTPTADVVQNALRKQGLYKIDKKIKDFSFSKDSDKRITLQIGNNWYSVNCEGEDFRQKNMAVVTSTKNDQLVCPDGKHYLGNAGGFNSLIKLEWNGHAWGSYVTPVKGTPKMWIDYELPEHPITPSPVHHDFNDEDK